MEKSEVLFHKWYVEPLRELERLPGGNGGFIALATSCFLYERYAVAVIKSAGKGKADDETKISQFEKDFGVDKETARFFWEVIRDGLLHQAMPKQRKYGKKTLPKWAFQHDFPRPVELVDWQGQPVLKVQPWLFMNRVIELWSENMDLLEQSDSFPWANVFPLPF
jgi:hypothetical protein